MLAGLQEAASLLVTAELLHAGLQRQCHMYRVCMEAVSWGTACQQQAAL
jgi:hypothetical protein